jgi:flagellin-like hook-associated protein FlgL
MSISSVGARSALSVRALADMRSQLDDLQRQLGTGKKADTYAGIGVDRGLVVGLRNQLSAIAGYQNSITSLNVRLNMAQTTLGRLSDIGRTMKSAALTSSSIQSNGTTIAQSTAVSSLGEMLGLLNTQVGDRYIFSGSGADQQSVASLSEIMDGDGIRAGFKQVVAERRLADLGTSGLGRLDISAPTPTSVQIQEQPSGPFGFKLAGISSSLTNSTVTGPAGVPPAVSVALTGQPNEGENVQFRFTLPDGSSESITLTATNSATPGPNEFTIGPTTTLTAGNLQTALTNAVDKLASTALTAASAVKAADNFFNGTPQRVAGPFDTASTLVPGTSSNTVTWYTGENGAAPARSTAGARIDTSISVSYGMRANEEGIRWIVQNVAALAAVTYSPTDPNAQALAAALHSRIGDNLNVPAGIQQIQDIAVDLAGAQTTIQSATDRHQQTKSTLTGMLDQIEGAPTEEVAAQILALQTRLQASLQTTSLLYHTSLVNYL